MKAIFASKKTRLGLSLTCICVLVMGLAACAPQQPSEDANKGAESVVDFKIPAANENGIITADAWQEVYPDEYATYKQNEDNKDPGDTRKSIRRSRPFGPARPSRSSTPSRTGMSIR